MEFVGKGIKLNKGDIKKVAENMGCEVEVIEAVRDIESSGSGFLPDNRPKILFEAHIFSRLTNHEFDDSYPNISSRVWDRNLYGSGGGHQYERLSNAILLNRRAGLNSCSWGMFQVLGLNDGQCGYDDVEVFVEDMMESEEKQLMIFENFCLNGGLTKYLVNKDWVRFALRYNGSGEGTNHYDEKLKLAYLRHKTNDKLIVPGYTDAPDLISIPLLHKGSQGDEVKKLQTLLLGVEVDGDFGNLTEIAVKKFQISHGLVSDGWVGPKTWKELGIKQ